MKRLFTSLLLMLACGVVSGVHADLIKQGSVYTRTVLMTASSDHITGATGLTLTISASKAGATPAVITPTVTEIGSGRYALALTTTQTNTLGALDLIITATGADPTDSHDQIVAFDPQDVAALGLTRLDVNVGSRLATTGYTAPVAFPSDYQQRGVAVTLPTLPNVTIGGYATGQDPVTLLMATLLDGSLTYKQAQTIALGTSLESDRTWNATTHTAVLTWYRRAAGAATADKTKPVKVQTTVYASDNVQIVSQTTVLQNLP